MKRDPLPRIERCIERLGLNRGAASLDGFVVLARDSPAGLKASLVDSFYQNINDERLRRKVDPCVLPPPEVLAAGNLFLGYTSNGQEVYFDSEDLMMIVGAPNSAKSTMLCALAEQGLRAMKPTILVDGKQDARHLAAEYGCLAFGRDFPICLVELPAYRRPEESIATIVDVFAKAQWGGLFFRTLMRSSIFQAFEKHSKPSLHHVQQAMQGLHRKGESPVRADQIHHACARLLALKDYYPGAYFTASGDGLSIEQLATRYSLLMPMEAERDIDRLIVLYLTRGILEHHHAKQLRGGFRNLFLIDEAIGLIGKDTAGIEGQPLSIFGVCREAGISIVLTTNSLTHTDPTIRTQANSLVVSTVHADDRVEVIRALAADKTLARWLLEDQTVGTYAVRLGRRWRSPLIIHCDPPSGDKFVSDETWKHVVGRVFAIVPRVTLPTAEALPPPTPLPPTPAKADQPSGEEHLFTDTERRFVNTVFANLVPISELHLLAKVHPVEGTRIVNKFSAAPFEFFERHRLPNGRKRGKTCVVITPSERLCELRHARPRWAGRGSGVAHDFLVEMTKRYTGGKRETHIAGRFIDLCFRYEPKHDRFLSAAKELGIPLAPQAPLAPGSLIAYEVEHSRARATGLPGARQDGVRVSLVIIGLVDPDIDSFARWLKDQLDATLWPKILVTDALALLDRLDDDRRGKTSIPKQQRLPLSTEAE